MRSHQASTSRHHPSVNTIILYQNSKCSQKTARNHSKNSRCRGQLSREYSSLRDNKPNRQPSLSTRSMARLHPQSYQINKLTSQAYNMEDPQKRLYRNHSTLYQNSNKQSDLFQKGIKKILQKNLNLISKVQLKDQPQVANNNRDQIQRSRSIKRQYKNQQTYNFLDLTQKVTVDISLSHRSRCKINPNQQSAPKQESNTKKIFKEKLCQANSQQSDYVVKALSTHINNGQRQIHLKFKKKDNLVNKENLKQMTAENQQKILKHRKHFNQLTTKQNIQVKENGICLRTEHYDKKKIDVDFCHDYYKKQSRMGIDQKGKRSMTYRSSLSTNNNNKPFSNKTQFQPSRMGKLRMKFL